MEFGDFLGQIGNQTGTKLQLPNTEEIMQRHLAEEAPPAPPPKPVVTASNPIAPAQSDNELKEDSIERVYEATAAVMKSIRKAFPNKAEQQLAYRSIYEAISTVMTGAVPAIRMNENQRTAPQQTALMQREDGSFEQTVIPKGGFIPRENDLDGTTIDMSEYHRQVNESMPSGDGYNRAIDIKPNQGLAGVSQRDIDDLKKLAGIS